MLGPKEGHFKSGAEIPEGVVRALVTLQHGLQQDACMLLAVRQVLLHVRWNT